MKKLLLVIVAIAYLAASSGMVLHVHYCMGKLVTWDLNDSNTNNSSCSTSKLSPKSCKKEGCDCCKDKHTYIKLQSEHKESISIKAICCIKPCFYEALEPEKLFQYYSSSNIYRTPYRPKIPYYIFNCVFRI